MGVSGTTGAAAFSDRAPYRYKTLSVVGLFHRIGVPDPAVGVHDADILNRGPGDGFVVPDHETADGDAADSGEIGEIFLGRFLLIRPQGERPRLNYPTAPSEPRSACRVARPRPLGYVK